MGKFTPVTAKMPGSTHIIIFCCLAIGLSSASADMFFMRAWREDMNVATDIKMIKMTVTTLTCMSSLLIKLDDSGAPNSDDCWALSANLASKAPIVFSPDAMAGKALSTRKSEKKMGICSRSGRHEDRGLVAVRL